MSFYDTSTQKKFWSLSRESIEDRRRSTRDATRARLVEAGLDESMLSPEEEQELLCYYEKRIVKIVRSMQLPTKTAATAVSYFRRFFLQQNLMDYNPSVVSLSSIYAAFKVEETVVDADTLVQVVGESDGVAAVVPASTVLSVELGFLETLNFQLICFHPFRSLDAIVKRLVELTADRNRVHGVAQLAKDMLATQSMHSDLPLLYPPGTVALGGLQAASAKLDTPVMLPEFLAELYSRDGRTEAQRATLEAEMDDIVKVMSVTKNVIEKAGDLKRMAKLERRRHQCSVPELDPESEVCKENERKATERRERQQARKARRTEKAVRRERAQLTGTEVDLSDDVDEDDRLSDEIDVDDTPVIDLDGREAPVAKRLRMSIS